MRTPSEDREHPPWAHEPDRTFVNAFSPGLGYSIWFWLEHDFDDLYVEEIGEDASERPDWLADWLVENNAKGLDLGRPRDGSTPVTQWAIETGIAPYQPFCVRFDEMRTWQSHEGDWNAEVDWEIVAIAPVSQLGLERRWERWFVELARAREEDRREAQIRADEDAAFAAFIRADLDALFIGSDWHFSRFSSWDDMATPDTLRLTLCSTHVHPRYRHSAVGYTSLQIYGEDARGDWLRARARLMAAAAEALPALGRERLLALPQRSLRF